VRKQQDPNQLSVPVPNAGCSLVKLSFVPNPAVLSSIILPVIVNREQWKCVSGNVINLLEYINHFNSSVKVEISKCDFNSMSISSVKLIMKKCNYEIFILPQEINFSLLQSFVLNLGLPMLLSLTLSYAGVEYKHIIGISPFKETPSSEATYHIIDGAHSKRMAIEFSEDTLNWCCEDHFQCVSHGFSFIPGNKQVLEMCNQKMVTALFQEPLCA
jgi:hypothetical protein